jgi:hypothetical protein
MNTNPTHCHAASRGVPAADSVGVQPDTGDVSVPEYQGLPTGTVTRLELGPPDRVPDDVHLDKMAPDYQLAKIYFNGMLWHSDTKKAGKFEAASAQMRAFYAKCAEIRTLTAFERVLGVRKFVHQARTLGHDL